MRHLIQIRLLLPSSLLETSPHAVPMLCAPSYLTNLAHAPPVPHTPRVAQNNTLTATMICSVALKVNIKVHQAESVNQVIFHLILCWFIYLSVKVGTTIWPAGLFLAELCFTYPQLIQVCFIWSLAAL